MPADKQTESGWFRQVLGQYPTGVCVVTAKQTDGTRAGFVVGSFTSVSLDPMLVAFLADKRSTSWSKIRSAGAFCVNILGADQEHICRRFASRGDDKFQGIECREAESGSPIISGVVAWIDCEIESVLEGGDHDIVLGRVRHLDLEDPSLPLLFFQGGYGRFTPLSLAAANTLGALTNQLRDVDLIRTEMERLATDLAARCIAAAEVDGEVVVVASAGSPNAGSAATLVGQHLPFAPPNASVLAAWREATEINAWLAAADSDTKPADQRERLAAVRRRGYSVGQTPRSLHRRLTNSSNH